MGGFRDGFRDLGELKKYSVAQLERILTQFEAKASASTLVDVQNFYRTRADEVRRELDSR